MNLSDLPDDIVESVDYEQYRVIVRKGHRRRTKRQRPRSKWLRPWWKGRELPDGVDQITGGVIEYEVWTTGGKVVCTITLKDGAVCKGAAWCSMCETFSYAKTWKNAALGRAVKEVLKYLEIETILAEGRKKTEQYREGFSISTVADENVERTGYSPYEDSPRAR